MGCAQPPNERLELTKSTPRLTAEGVAFAAQSRCSADLKAALCG